MFTRKVNRDLLLAAFIQFYQKLAGVAVMALMARHLPVDTMGRFFLVVSVISFFALATELGTTRYLLQRVAESAERALDDLAEVLTARMVLIVPVFLALNTTAAVIAPELFIITLLASVYLFLQELSYPFAALFIGIRRIGCRVVTGTVGYTTLLATVVAVIALDGSIEAILGCYILSNMLLLAASAFVVRRRFGRFRIAWHRLVGVTKAVIGDSIPFFVISLLSLVNFKLGALMLGGFDSFEAVARYEAGNRLLEASRVLIRPVAMVFFPICAAMALRGAWMGLRQVFFKIALLTVGLGLLLTLLVNSAAEPLVFGLYGTQYSGTEEVTRILFLAAPALFLGSTALFLAKSIHMERQVLLFMAWSVLLNLILNAVLVPWWGAQGAAWATFATQWIVMLGLVRVLVNRLGREPEAVPVPAGRISYAVQGTDGPPAA